MKSILPQWILCISLLIMLFSCTEDEKNFPPHYFVYINNGAYIKGVSIHAYQGNESNYDISEAIIEDYSDLHLEINLNTTLNDFKLGDDDLNKRIDASIRSFLDNRAEFIEKDIINHQNNMESVGSEQFLTAYINGEVEITCDKILYGLEPGKNLIDHFQHIYNFSCQPKGMDNPYISHHADEIGQLPAGSIMGNEDWVRYKYILIFNDIPEEKYDEIELRIKMPLKKELIHKYVASLITEIDFGEFFEDVTYESSTKIRFASGK